MAPAPAPRPTGVAGLLARARAWAGEKGSARRVIARNGAWESSGFLVHAAVMFLLSPFIVVRLGNSLYGVWEIAISLTGFLSFAELGVRPAAVYFIARYDARGDYEALNRYVNTTFVTFATAGLVVMATAVPLAFLLPRLVNMAPGFETEAGIALVLLAGELALSLPLNAFSAVLVGKQRYDRLGVIRVTMLFVRAGLIVLVLSEGGGLVALGLVIAGTGVAQMAAFTVSAFRLEPHLRFDPRLASREALQKLLGFGGWAMAVVLALQVIWATDALVIGRAISDAAVAYFAVGFKLAFYAREFLRVTSRVVEPAVSALHGMGDKDGIRNLLTKSMQVMLLFAGPIVVYLFVVGEPFLRTWMREAGEEFARESSGVLWIMTLAVVPAIASAPLGAVHYGTNRVRPYALLVLGEAVLNLGLSIALVGPYGIEGVAIGTAVPALLVHAVLLPLLLCRHYGLAWGPFVLRTWAGPVVAAVPAYVVLRLIVDPSARYGWPALLGLAALSVVLYGISVLALSRVAPGLLGKGPLLRAQPPAEADA